MEGLLKNDVSELSRQIHRIHRIPSDPPETVSASAPQTLPSTRAGGQDDVSSNKLPQIMNMCRQQTVATSPKHKHEVHMLP